MWHCAQVWTLRQPFPRRPALTTRRYPYCQIQWEDVFVDMSLMTAYILVTKTITFACNGTLRVSASPTALSSGETTTSHISGTFEVPPQKLSRWAEGRRDRIETNQLCWPNVLEFQTSVVLLVTAALPPPVHRYVYLVLSASQGSIGWPHWTSAISEFFRTQLARVLALYNRQPAMVRCPLPEHPMMRSDNGDCSIARLKRSFDGDSDSRYEASDAEGCKASSEQWKNCLA